jgi:hypothetical protein
VLRVSVAVVTLLRLPSVRTDESRTSSSRLRSREDGLAMGFDFEAEDGKDEEDGVLVSALVLVLPEPGKRARGQ